MLRSIFSVFLFIFSFASLALTAAVPAASWRNRVKRLSTTMTCDLLMQPSTPQTSGDSLTASIENVIDQAVIEAAGDDSGAYRTRKNNDEKDTILPILSSTESSPTKYAVHSHIRLAEEDDDDVYEFVYYFEKKLKGKKWDGLGVEWAFESVSCLDD
jgi:hypothetical protein